MSPPNYQYVENYSSYGVRTKVMTDIWTDQVHFVTSTFDLKINVYLFMKVEPKWWQIYRRTICTCQPLETQMREISLIWSLQWGRFCVITIRDLFSVINNLFTFYSPIYPPYSPIIFTKYHEHCWNSDILISKLHMLQYFLSDRASMLSVISQSGTFSHLQQYQHKLDSYCAPAQWWGPN